MPVLAQFNENNFEATDQIRCLKIYVPDGDGYLPLVAGLLSLMGNPANYQEPESAQAEGVAAICRDAYIETSWEGCGTPPECIGMAEVNIWSNAVNVLVGNALLLTIDAAQIYNFTAPQNPALDGQETATSRYLAAGLWNYRYTYLRNTNQGITRIRFDDQKGTIVDIPNIDQRGALQRNTIATGQIVIPFGATGFYRITFTTVGTSGTGFTNNWTLLQLWQPS